jgi:hypothetical protein
MDLAVRPGALLRAAVPRAPGWIGVNFEGADWMEIAELVDESYRLAAPKS